MPPKKPTHSDLSTQAGMKESIDQMERSLVSVDQQLVILTTQMQSLVEASRMSRMWDLINRAAGAYGQMVMANAWTKAAAGATWTMVIGALILGFAARWFDVDVMLAFDGMKQATAGASDFIGPPAPE